MLMECDAIFNQFQRQPESEMQWALLRWANRTVTVLPLLVYEAIWPIDLNIPPFFNYQEHTDDVSYDQLYEMVNIFFNRYGCGFKKKTTEFDFILFLDAS